MNGELLVKTASKAPKQAVIEVLACEFVRFTACDLNIADGEVLETANRKVTMRDSQSLLIGYRREESTMCFVSIGRNTEIQIL